MTAQLTTADLPNPGQGRFWRIKRNPKSRTQPLTIQLIEPFREGSTVGETVGWEYAEANKRDLHQKAELVLIRAADYKLMVGDYGVAPVS